mmetsp:Transcript_6856/g.22032  ORF Transcript_6856/g.22032 Transcript_6856/m.22032 type:complete len:209 (-) Transcript_6856:12-638(-)
MTCVGSQPSRPKAPHSVSPSSSAVRSGTPARTQHPSESAIHSRKKTEPGASLFAGERPRRKRDGRLPGRAVACSRKRRGVGGADRSAPCAESRASTPGLVNARRRITQPSRLAEQLALKLASDLPEWELAVPALRPAGAAAALSFGGRRAGPLRRTGWPFRGTSACAGRGTAVRLLSRRNWPASSLQARPTSGPAAAATPGPPAAAAA